MAPPLTVAISVFNRDKSAAAIAAPLAPPLRDTNAEAQIIDNGSREGSWELPQGVRKDWPRRRLLRNKLVNSLTFSLCQKEARGESFDGDR
jgi:hypothetical protein